MSFLQSCFGNGQMNMYAMAVVSTLKVTLISFAVSYLLGLPLGVLLYGTASDGIFPNRPLSAVLDVIVNIIRSIPFIILLVMIQPLARIVVGTKIGDNAFIFYLIVASFPYVARMIESSLREVDRGVIEAAQSMGSNNFQLVTKVIIPEAKPSLIIGAAIAITTILGYTPMAYLIAGSGLLGQLAIQYGLYRFDSRIMYISSLLLIILVQIMQVVFNYFAKKTDKRIRN